MSKEDFYSFNIQKKEKGIAYVIGLASIVVIVILYPMWPYPIKLGIFYVAFGLLCFLVALNILWLILWLVFFVFGMDFWLIPRLYDDSAGVFGSFLPIHSFECWKQDGLGMMLFWFMLAVITALVVAYYVQVFSFEELESMYYDTFDWTKNKIVGNNTYALTIKGGHGKYGSIEEILKMTEE